MYPCYMLSLSREKIYKGLRPRPIAYTYAFVRGLGLRPYTVKELKMKLLTMLDFPDNFKMKKLFVKNISPQIQKNKELTSMIAKIHQMYLLVQLQKVISLDCKEIFRRVCRIQRTFKVCLGSMHTTIPIASLMLLSGSCPQEKMEKFLTQVFIR